MLGIKRNPEEERENKLLEKQEESQKEITLLNNATDSNTELIQQERNKDREDLVKWQQDLLPEINQLERDLRREVYNFNTEQWEPSMETGYDEHGNLVTQVAKPMCNEFCIQMIKTIIRPFMNKNEIMSNYTEERILIKLKATIKTLVRNIGLKYDFYEIDFHDISAIRQTIQNVCMSAPYRALNNGERKHLQSSTRRIESVSESQFENKKNNGVFKNMGFT